MKIMVADDSSTMRTIVKRHLASIGVDDVIEAKDGDDAVEKFKSQAVDLVLTDWNMPGKTGLEVLKEIRKTDALAVDRFRRALRQRNGYVRSDASLRY